MDGCTCYEDDILCTSMDEINAWGLLQSAIGAARAQVDYTRAQTAGRRSEVLLGKYAGREHAYRAELYFDSRREHLQAVKQSYTQFIAGLDKNQKKQISDFLRSEGLKELTEAARRTVTLGLLEADLSPDEAGKAAKALDGTLKTVARLTSFDKLDQYMRSHLDELASKPFGNPGIAQGLCIIILIITSIFAVLVLVAALICALTLGLACQGLLQRLIDQACPA